MKNLSITLNQDYKSFKAGFSSKIEGELIILSGVNGSGKSQIMDIVRQTDAVGQTIDATIIVDETPIIKNNIIYKSFKDNINPPSIQTSGINGYTQVSNNIYNHYMQLRAHGNLPHLLSFSYSWNTIEKILLENSQSNEKNHYN
jgi:predicted ATP-binding protein involved in virulence